MKGWIVFSLIGLTLSIGASARPLVQAKQEMIGARATARVAGVRGATGTGVPQNKTAHTTSGSTSNACHALGGAFASNCTIGTTASTGCCTVYAD
jgi:hypothetical protein